MDKLREKIKDENVLWAFEKIIYSAPVACPVGYYTSPFFANLYLQDLDWFIEKDLYKVRRGKKIKFVRHMIRYMDDLLLVGTSKLDLKKAVYAIIDHLDKYDLKVKPTWEIKVIGKHELIDGEWKLKPNTFWCDMGGYKFCKDATILRSGIFLASMRLARKMFREDYHTIHQCKSIVSRVGWSCHCNNDNYVSKIKNYVDLKTTRRIISDVEKGIKRRKP